MAVKLWRFCLRIVDLASWTVFGLALALALHGDAFASTAVSERVRIYTRPVEFDFVGWSVNAAATRLAQAALGEQAYLDSGDRAAQVQDYFDLVERLEGVEREIAAQYANPAVADPAAETAGLRYMQAELRQQIALVQPLAETVLQEQISVVAAAQGLALGGQPAPPVAFRFTQLPLALIVSPRDTIRQAAFLDVAGDLTLEQQVELERRVQAEMNVSALVVPLGGIGTYPTMVLRSSDLNWIASVVAHEWVHNYLTLRPLGLYYDRSPELRTMNETAASLAGDELGALVMQTYYPRRAWLPPLFDNFLLRDQPPPGPASAPRFDFRAEMHATRVRVDELLAAGEVGEAEDYMEARRRVFWDNGYQLRRLNQAYFAFHGAYAADGGATGSDPVGPAVRLLRRRSPDLAAFLNTLAGFTSFDQLRRFLALP